MKSKERAVDMLRAGEKYSTIRAATGLAFSTISKHAEEIGLGRGKKPRRNCWTEVQTYLDQGHSLAECKRSFRIGHSTMQAALKAGEVRLLPSKRIAELSLSEYAAIKQGQHNPGIQTGLRCRALAEDVPYRCRVCGISEWQGQSIVLRLDHVNGDRRDHSVLAFICPNCDSQQPSYHYRNRGKYS